MKKKSLGIFISLLMLATCIGPTIFTENELNVKATSTTGGNVGLDYDTIYEKLETLSYVVFNASLKDHGIYKGRDFGTVGDWWAADRIKEWMIKFSVNLTGSDVEKERIGYFNSFSDYWYPKKSDIEGFSLQLKNGTHEAFTISTNESMPVVSKTLLHYIFPKHYTTSDFCTIERYTKIMDDTHPLDEYDYKMFNVTYTRINDPNNFSQMGLDDELVFIDNYSNASFEDIEGRIHLINVSNNELNETVNHIADANATGYILIRDNVNDIQGWDFPIPGIAVSDENGSLIKSYIQNESLFNVSALTPEPPIPEQGNLMIYYFNNTGQFLEKKIWLVDMQDFTEIWFPVALNIRSIQCRIAGILWYDSGSYDPMTHSENVPNFWEPLFFIKFSSGTKKSIKKQYDSFSGLRKPWIYINKTIIADDGPHDIGTWVGNPKNEVKAKFLLNWSKNPNVESYNVYCTVPGKNPSKTVIISGGHYDGFWGQMATDNAAGVAVMLGILKYMNDNHITPKCNLVFITFSGEEYIDKGSRGYVLRHWDEIDPNDIECIINLDVLAHDQVGSTLYIHSSDRWQPLKKILINNIVTQIAESTNYQDANLNKYTLVALVPWDRGWLGDPLAYYPGVDEFPFWLRGITAINFGKEPYNKTRHQTGSNHTRGDNMTHIDWNDLNYTTDLVWNVSKYFCVNPDCWFEDITYQTWDSPDDNNEYNDSVNVTFSINTSLPHDRVWVKATLISQDHPILCRYKTQQHYIITPSGIQDTLTITLLPRAPKGNYILQVFLYNSTGEVDRSLITLFDYLDFGKYANETYQTDEFYLHPPNDPPATPLQPWGNTSIVNRGLFPYTTNTTDPNGDTIWYQWNWSTGLGINYYTRWVIGGPYDSGENCTRYIGWLFPGAYQVRVRAKDNLWNPNVMSDWSPPLNVSVSQAGNGAASFNNMLLGQFTSTMVAMNQQTSCTGFAAGVNPSQNQRGSLDWTWDLGDGNVSYEQDVTHTYTQPGNYTVNLTLENGEGGMYNSTTTISVLVLRADFITSGSAQPNKTVIFNDTSVGVYSIVNWTWDFGDGNISYDRNTSHTYTETGEYNVTLTVRDTLNDIHMYAKPVFVESLAPDFVSVVDSPDPVGFGHDVTISVDFFDNQSGVESVMVNITYPDNTTGNFSMEQNVSSEHDYVYLFNDTWQNGVYNYSIWVRDFANNTNCTSGFNFTVSGEANITVSTTKNSYSGNEYINLTDPPGDPSPSLGYELLEDGAVLHLWNRYDSYYFNTSSGIQLTNHKDDFWSHNVLMLGYFNNDQWHLVYRTDELTGFSQDIETDNTNFVNITLWKDLTYSGYSFRFALRYHLGVNDNDLTVIPSIKNTGTNAIPYVLGFGWELKDIQINMTTTGDYIMVDQDTYYLNQTLNNSYTDLEDSVFYIMENGTGSQMLSLYLRWDPGLTYKLQVKSRLGQANAPVTLFIRVGTLASGQQKHTELRWYDASQVTYYFNDFNAEEAWETYPECMVDGSTESFASTGQDGSVELCTSNTCDGEDLGAYSKVELRAHGYYEEKPGNITLRPVFGGKTDGENYTFAAPDQPEWSPWFDITGDEHGPWNQEGRWSWSDVQTLACDVEASLEDEHCTLYCSMVELRVTYNNAPTLTNPVPVHGSNGIPLQPMLNITVSDPDSDTMNISWYSNSTPSYLTLRPNANGSITELERYPTSQNANYKCVDETVANDSDYVKWKGSSWKKDTYNLPNHTDQSGMIHEVTVYARCARVGSMTYPITNSSAKIVIRSGGSYYYGSEFKPPYSPGPPVSYTNYNYIWKINPATGNAWTWNDIDNLQAGIAFIGTEGSSECTHLYVVVNYTNPSTWLQFGRNSSVGNGVYRQRFLNATVNGQWWYWKVKADDGTASTWSSVYKFYTGNQSKIENTGNTNIKGYLLMQIQFYNETSGTWVLDNDTVNETSLRTISNGNQLALDTIFNGKVRASDLQHGTGTYRVYTAFRDPEGNILKTNTGSELKAWWQFSKT